MPKVNFKSHSLFSKTICFIVCSILISSCDNQPSSNFKSETIDTSTKDTSSQINKTLKSVITDSSNLIEVDKYPITAEQIDLSNQIILDKFDDYKIASSGVYSYDKAWLRNDSLNEIIVVGLYTDGFRTFYIHFKKQFIIEDLMSYIGLTTENGQLANLSQIKASLRGFISKSPVVPSQYFTSSNGIQLGKSKEQVLKVYGIPDNISKKEGIEKYEWHYAGDKQVHVARTKVNKPFAKNSYGYSIYAYFKDSVLIAHHIQNEIP